MWLYSSFCLQACKETGAQETHLENVFHTRHSRAPILLLAVNPIFKHTLLLFRHPSKWVYLLLRPAVSRSQFWISDHLNIWLRISGKLDFLSGRNVHFQHKLSFRWQSRKSAKCENHIQTKLRIPDAQLESFMAQVQRSATALELDSPWCSVILGMYDQAKMQYPNVLLPKLMSFHVNT